MVLVKVFNKYTKLCLFPARIIQTSSSKIKIKIKEKIIIQTS